jgi:hypothetical protein
LVEKKFIIINFICIILTNSPNVNYIMDDNGTVAQIYKEEYMDLCACKKGAKAVYYCNVKDCPDNRTRPTYCS